MTNNLFNKELDEKWNLFFKTVQEKHSDIADIKEKIFRIDVRHNESHIAFDDNYDIDSKIKDSIMSIYNSIFL